jgi:hypothetical protein
LVFGCAILTNVYCGMVTTDLAAPLARYRITTLDEALALNFEILLNVDMYWPTYGK